MMARLFDRIRRGLLGAIAGTVEVHGLNGFTVVVENKRPDIATPAVLERLTGALELIERHQPWRLTHLRRDLRSIQVMRFPCRGAYFREQRACMVELTFLARRDIGPETVASTIIHEGMHARVDRFVSRVSGDPPASRDRSREERLCRRAELEFGLALPPEMAGPVVDRARASLELADEDVAPDIDWGVAMRRVSE